MMSQHSSSPAQDGGARENRSNPHDSQLDERCREIESLFDSVFSEEAASPASEKERLRRQLARAEECETHLGQVLQAIRKLNRLIVQERDPQQILKTAVATLTETAGYQGVWIALFNGNGDEPAMAEACHLGREFGTLRERLLNGDFPPCAKQALTDDKTLVIRHPDQDCRDCPLSRTRGQCAVLVHKIAMGSRVFGVLAAHIPHQFADAEQELGLFEELADDLAFAIGRIQDLKERREAEEALRKSAEKYHDLFENMAAASCINELVYEKGRAVNYRILDVNSTYERLAGIPKENVVGRLASEVYGTDEIPFFDLFAKVAETGKPVSFEGFFAPVGKYLAFTVSCPSPGRFSNVVRDVTDRKEAEERLRASELRYTKATTAGRVSVWDWDAESGILVYDPIYWTALGYSVSDAEKNPQLWREVIHPDDVGAVSQAARSCLAGETPSYDMEHRVINKSGGIVWVHARGEVTDEGQRMVGTAQDITQRKEAEDALIASEHRFRSFVENANDLVYSVTPEGLFAYVSPNWQEFMGEPVDSPIGKSFEEYVHPDDVRLCREFLQHVLSIGTGEQTVEYRVFRADGSMRWHVSTGSVLRDHNGNVTSCVGIARDVTEAKRAETALRLSEARYRSLAENFPNGALFLFDRDFRYLAADGKAIREAGLSSDLLVGKTVQEAFPELWPTIHPHAEAALNGKESYYEVEYRGRLYSNQSLPITDEQGSTGQALVVTQDITELRAGEVERERLLSAVEQSGEAIVVTDPDGAIQYANPAFEEITGYSLQEAIGRNPRFLKSGEQDDEFYQRLWATISAGCTWQGRFINRKKDGSLYTEDATISPVWDKAGKLRNYIAVKRDISKEIDLEERYHQSQKLEAIGQLAGGIAHDFNNLLLVINGYSQMAHESLEEGSQAKTALEGVMEAGRRAATLVSQLLAFSRKQFMRPENLDLNEVVSHLMKMLTRIIGEQIRLDFVPGHPLGRVWADRGMMEQIIMNLSVNARDVMPDGGELTIETDEVELNGDFAETQSWVEPGPYVVLTISDTGCGMDEETLSHIFEPFFTTKGVGEGTGLGLATVYGIVRQHNGAIVTSSTPGKGTTFEVYLPVTRKESAREEPNRATVPAGGTETILLAEDDPAVLKLVRQLLERMGYTVLTAGNGKVAVDLFERNADEVKLVILDVVMPEMGGREAFAAIRRKNPDIPVLFASGYSDNSLDTDFILSESLTLLRKPYEPAELSRAVRQSLDSQ